ncbi:MAG TPA: SRPBCC family protein [Candidatus Angelobacter sp.]|nr:SRPBCC family protein [Candidatus Angelobacter sp.]
MSNRSTKPASPSGRTWVEGGYARSSVTGWAPVPVAEAFSYVADMTRHPEWANDPLTVERLDPDPVGVGTRYRAVGHQGGRDWPSDLTVTGFEPPSRFEFTATGGPIGTTDSMLHRHELLLTATDGGTQIEIRRADPLVGAMMRLVGRPFVRATLGMRLRTVARLTERLTELASAEGSGGS